MKLSFVSSFDYFDDLRFSISFSDVGCLCSWCIIAFFNLLLNSHELALSKGLMIPVPPSWHGRAINFCSSSNICKSLNKTGINFSLMIFSTSDKNILMFLMVLTKNVSLCLYPDVKSEYCACGCVLMINDNSLYP